MSVTTPANKPTEMVSIGIPSLKPRRPMSPELEAAAQYLDPTPAGAAAAYALGEAARNWHKSPWNIAQRAVDAGPVTGALSGAAGGAALAAALNALHRKGSGKKKFSYRQVALLGAVLGGLFEGGRGYLHHRTKGEA